MINFPRPSRWHFILIGNVVIIAWCMLIAIVAGPSWVTMVDTALAGAALSTIFHIRMYLRSRKLIAAFSGELQMMIEINTELMRRIEQYRGEILSPTETTDAPRIYPTQGEDRDL